MVRILLVDDEPFMRSALRSFIDWDKYGFQIVGDAYNGEEALHMIEKQRVDIVITDIKMPVMDGLELIKTVTAGKANIRFVVLSAYEEFHLVRDAYKLGASDYILKAEMLPEQIVRILKKLEDDIIKEQKEINDELEQKKIHAVYKNLLLENQLTVKEKMLKELVWGDTAIDVQKVKLFLDAGLRLNHYKIKVLVLKLNRYEEYIGMSNYQKQLLKFKVLDTVEDILNKFKLGNVFCNDRNEYCILLCFNKAYNDFVIDSKILQIHEEVVNALKLKLDIAVSMGLSTSGSGYSCCRMLYEQALDAAEFNYFRSDVKLIHYYHLPKEKDTQSLQVLTDKMVIFKQFLQKLYSLEYAVSMNEFKVSKEEACYLQVGDIKRHYYKYYLYIMEFSEQHFLLDSIKEWTRKFEEYLYRFGNLADINQWVEEILSKLYDEIGQNNLLVKKAKKYIHQFYNTEISLTAVADKLGVSSGYLSRIFLKQTGLHFKEYINNYRIKAAMDYMKNTDLKVYEISEKVGFKSPEYFSRTFKSITGRNPKEGI